MPAYNFKKQFAPLVESGEKRQTIRSFRKWGHVRPGERLQLYTGMRTKACRKLIDPDPVCVSAVPITMEVFNYVVLINVDGVLVDDAEALATADGFKSLGEFIDFFRTAHGFPFRGTLIKW